MGQRGYSIFGVAVGLGVALFFPRAPAPAGPVPQLSVAQGAPEEIRLRRRGNGHFYIHGMVDGQIVEFMVDTGASDVALTVADAQRAGIAVGRKGFSIIGTGAGGPIEGQISRVRSVEVAGRTLAHAEVMIADGLDQSLLGQEFLRRFGTVQMNGDQMVLR